MQTKISRVEYEKFCQKHGIDTYPNIVELAKNDISWMKKVGI